MKTRKQVSIAAINTGTLPYPSNKQEAAHKVSKKTYKQKTPDLLDRRLGLWQTARC